MWQACGNAPGGAISSADVSVVQQHGHNQAASSDNISRVRGSGQMQSLIVKRSVAVKNRKTSISLEDEFWETLESIASEQGETLSNLIININANRECANLSSAIRLFILRYYRDEVERQGGRIVASPTLAPLIEHAPFMVRP
jgi:predicted DNA-binding ribbon-helix-helix protein